jgi:4-alpha-glucanotransferase
MIDATLQQLADAGGVATRWIDYRGEPQQVSEATVRAILAALEIPCETMTQANDSLAQLRDESARGGSSPLAVASVGEPVRVGGVATDSVSYRITFEDGSFHDGVALRDASGKRMLTAVSKPGYHRVEIGDETFALAVAPRRCFGVSDVADTRKRWGLTTQLYGLRRRGDGGIGDFTGLAQFAIGAAAHGADAVAVSPMHALFAADLNRFSPYAPSSRLFLNVLHVDPAEAFGAAEVQAVVAATGLAEEFAGLEKLPLVNWPAAARARLRVLRMLYERFPAAPEFLRQDFNRYRDEGGSALRDHARFEALHAHFFSGSKPRWNWRDWPAAYRDSESNKVAAFAEDRAEEVRFHTFLQWLAERGLRSAQAAARSAGMKIGLIGDLAVGTDRGGSHCWSRQHDMLIGVSVGAPPDYINAVGQNWGLTSFSPRALKLHGYAPFLEMLRAQLRHVGGLRIDHVLGLGRLWLVPDGASATEGAYLHYPIDDLFKLIALESWRHRAIIIGEDMGTVPEGFRDRLADVGILGMRVLWFERDWGLFVDPSRWPSGAVAMTTTHDLPTVAGWWSGRDIEWRQQLDLFGPHTDQARETAARAEDRAKLWDAFRHADVAQGPAPSIDDTDSVATAAAAFIGRTPSPLALLPMEDALGLVEQPNIPGTIDEHPNWRRRLPEEADMLLSTPEVSQRLQAMDTQRKGGG